MMLGQRMASFRMTREEQQLMSSKTRTWRQTLTQDTAMIDKIKTVNEIFKRIGSKVVQEDKLIPLLKKKAQPQELKQALQKQFEQGQFQTLMEYLGFFSEKHVVQSECGKFLQDVPELISSVSNLRQNSDTCIN